MVKKSDFNRKSLITVGLNIVLAVVLLVVVLWGVRAWLNAYTHHGVEISVQDVRGLLVMDAKPLLEAQGLRMTVIDSTYSNKVPLGTIVDQDPKPSCNTKEGRIVYVTINATTKRQITMPNLQDMSYRQAETTLRGMGLVVDTMYEYQPSVFPNLVLDIKSNGVSVAPGEKVPVGTKVQLVIGFGRGEEQVEVPNILGLTVQEARSLLLSHRLTIGATYYDEPELKDQEQFIYNQSPKEGEQIVEGEAISIYLSIDKEKSTRNTSGTQEEEDWF